MSNMRNVLSASAIFAFAALFTVAVPARADAQTRRQTPPVQTDNDRGGQNIGLICAYIRGERVCPRDGLM
jgi:hypothetical protein